MRPIYDIVYEDKTYRASIRINFNNSNFFEEEQSLTKIKMDNQEVADYIEQSELYIAIIDCKRLTLKHNNGDSSPNISSEFAESQKRMEDMVDKYSHICREDNRLIVRIVTFL